MDEKPDGLYPTPTKGDLKTAPASKPEKARWRLRPGDFSAITIIGFVIGTVVAIAVGSFFIIRAITSEGSKQDKALVIANAVANHNPTEPYDTMRQHTFNALQGCSGNPFVVVTHHYSVSPGRNSVDYSSAELSEDMDLSVFLEEVVKKSDSAKSNEFSVSCISG